jgi:hypothetical protein
MITSIAFIGPIPLGKDYSFTLFWLDKHLHAKFGYKINIKVKTISTSFFCIFDYLLKPCIELWLFSLKFSGIMAIENLRKHYYF